MCRLEAGMHTITTLIAIFVIVTAIALVTSGSLTANAEAVKTKIKHHKRSSTRGTTGGGYRYIRIMVQQEEEVQVPVQQEAQAH